MPFTVYTLTREEQNHLLEACKEVHQNAYFLNQEDLVKKSEIVSKEFGSKLIDLKQSIQNLKNPIKPIGLLIIKGLPVYTDPKTLSSILGFYLGDVVKYPGEGDYIIEIKEQETKAGERPSFKDSKEFYLHSDLSYVETPPHYFFLQSIVNDTSHGGISTFCDIKEAVSQLSNLAMLELLKNQFEFPAPKHFKGVDFVRFPILFRYANHIDYSIRFRRDNLRSLTRSGIDAIIELTKILRSTSFELPLEDNTLAIIDNWAYLHGRTAFNNSGSLPTKQRWLNRTYVN